MEPLLALSKPTGDRRVEISNPIVKVPGLHIGPTVDPVDQDPNGLPLAAHIGPHGRWELLSQTKRLKFRCLGRGQHTNFFRSDCRRPIISHALLRRLRGNSNRFARPWSPS